MVVELLSLGLASRPSAMPPQPSPALRLNLLVTDLGFTVYWLTSALQLLPPEWLYKDHSNPILIAWNWSFAPVDLAASATGLLALWLARQNSPSWQHVAILSMTLTFAAGVFALSFWALRSDFDPAWWLPNVYLVVWPLLCICAVLPQRQPSAA